MPKQVDHYQRKVEIAKATWKVIVEEGLEKATVRKVAKAAGFSVGSLRHYFPTQSELLRFSMELVFDRINQRFQTKHYQGSPLEVLTEIFQELLPTNEEKRVETEVWFVFLGKALVDPNLKDLADKLYTEMHKAIRMIVHRLQAEGLLKEQIDPIIEANRLHSLIDGIAINHLCYPHLFPLEDVLRTLQYHLQSMIQPVGLDHQATTSTVEKEKS